MRTAAVSEVQVEGGVLTAAMALAGAVVGGVALWLAQRLLGKAAFQQAINDGFAKLTAQLQDERDLAKRELEQRQLAWEGERASLKGEIRNLTQTMESLKRDLARGGYELPSTSGAGREPEIGATILETKP